MNVEQQIARELNKLYTEEHFEMTDGVFQLSSCAPMVKESAADLYLALSPNHEQIDVVAEAIQLIQGAGEDDQALAKAFFGSPLHGMKLLRENIITYVVPMVEDEVNDYMAELITANHQGGAEDRAYELREVVA